MDNEMAIWWMEDFNGKGPMWVIGQPQNVGATQNFAFGSGQTDRATLKNCLVQQVIYSYLPINQVYSLNFWGHFRHPTHTFCSLLA